jgi:serine/threonine-protein kinase
MEPDDDPTEPLLLPDLEGSARTRPDYTDHLLERAGLLHSALEEEAAETSASTFVSQERPPERYEMSEIVGSGGAAEVWKAYDTHLRRFVALKFLKSTDPALADHFLREARAQARIHHKNVCQVYEVDKKNGRPCIVMQYIPGVTLREAAAEMSVEERIHVLKMTAEGVQAAHESGLIHRDLKPGNILVEKTAEGLQPYVLDFGLAHDLQSPGVTRTGTIVGSPYYMSPEQVRGAVRSLDRRTDVYSLGVILYELLCGHPPFNASNSAEVLVQILQDEPESLRKKDPDIPRDLEAVALKCLQKEPHRRYASVRAFIDDLDRYLRGEPVLARVPGRKEQLARVLRKHRAAATIGAAALAVVMILSGLWLRERWNAADRAKAAQQFGQQVESIRGDLRYAYALPLHDIRRDRARIRDRMTQMENQRQQLGQGARAAGDYALGSAHLALYEYESAKKRLQAAWDSGYRTPETAYSLGQLYGALYQQSLEIEQRGGGSISKERRKELEKQFLLPAREFLKASRSGRIESPEYLEGLIAFYDHQFAIALAHATNAFRGFPWLYESKKLEGDIYAAMGIKERDLDHPHEAVLHLQKAREAYVLASVMARSDPQVLLARCQAGIYLFEIDLYLQHSLPDSGETLDACELARKADPESADVHFALSRIHHRVGHFRMTHGQEFRADLELAIQEGEQAVQLNPSNPSFYEFLGLAHWRVAQYEMDKGENPLASLNKMTTVFKKMIEVNPSQQEGYSGLGIASFMTGEYYMDTGGNALPYFEAALRYYRKAMQINPSWGAALNGVGFSLVGIAEWKLSNGIDPRSFLEQAIPLYRENARTHPLDPIPLYFLSNVFLMRGEYESLASMDPADSWKEAVRTVSEAIRLDPTSAEAHCRLGRIHIQMARQAMKQSAAPAEYLEHAIRSFTDALNSNPRSSQAFRGLAAAHLLKAKVDLREERSPEASLREASLALARAGELNPNHYELFLLRGQEDMLRGEWAIHRKSSPQPYLDTAAAALEKAETLKADSAVVWMCAAELALNQAQWKKQKELMEQARAYTEKALQINPLFRSEYSSLINEIERSDLKAP